MDDKTALSILQSQNFTKMKEAIDQLLGLPVRKPESACVSIERMDARIREMKEAVK